MYGMAAGQGRRDEQRRQEQAIEERREREQRHREQEQRRQEYESWTRSNYAVSNERVYTDSEWAELSDEEKREYYAQDYGHAVRKKKVRVKHGHYRPTYEYVDRITGKSGIIGERALLYKWVDVKVELGQARNPKTGRYLYHIDPKYGPVRNTRTGNYITVDGKTVKLTKRNRRSYSVPTIAWGTDTRGVLRTEQEYVDARMALDRHAGGRYDFLTTAEHGRIQNTRDNTEGAHRAELAQFRAAGVVTKKGIDRIMYDRSLNYGDYRIKRIAPTYRLSATYESAARQNFDDKYHRIRLAQTTGRSNLVKTRNKYQQFLRTGTYEDITTFTKQTYTDATVREGSEYNKGVPSGQKVGAGLRLEDTPKNKKARERAGPDRIIDDPPPPRKAPDETKAKPKVVLPKAIMTPKVIEKIEEQGKVVTEAPTSDKIAPPFAKTRKEKTTITRLNTKTGEKETAEFLHDKEKGSLETIITKKPVDDATQNKKGGVPKSPDQIMREQGWRITDNPAEEEEKRRKDEAPDPLKDGRRKDDEGKTIQTIGGSTEDWLARREDMNRQKKKGPVQVIEVQGPPAPAELTKSTDADAQKRAEYLAVERQADVEVHEPGKVVFADVPPELTPAERHAEATAKRYVDAVDAHGGALLRDIRAELTAREGDSSEVRFGKALAGAAVNEGAGLLGIAASVVAYHDNRRDGSNLLRGGTERWRDHKRQEREAERRMNFAATMGAMDEAYYNADILDYGIQEGIGAYTGEAPDWSSDERYSGAWSVGRDAASTAGSVAGLALTILSPFGKVRKAVSPILRATNIPDAKGGRTIGHYEAEGADGAKTKTPIPGFSTGTRLSVFGHTVAYVQGAKIQRAPFLPAETNPVQVTAEQVKRGVKLGIGPTKEAQAITSSGAYVQRIANMEQVYKDRAEAAHTMFALGQRQETPVTRPDAPISIRDVPQAETDAAVRVVARGQEGLRPQVEHTVGSLTYSKYTDDVPAGGDMDVHVKNIRARDRMQDDVLKEMNKAAGREKYAKEKHTIVDTSNSRNKVVEFLAPDDAELIKRGDIDVTGLPDSHFGQDLPTGRTIADKRTGHQLANLEEQAGRISSSVVSVQEDVATGARRIDPFEPRRNKDVARAVIGAEAQYEHMVKTGKPYARDMRDAIDAYKKSYAEDPRGPIDIDALIAGGRAEKPGTIKIDLTAAPPTSPSGRSLIPSARTTGAIAAKQAPAGAHAASTIMRGRDDAPSGISTRPR
ncbi:MAG: hypothetical protein OXQ29_20135, partial [Rhodospirillaceae bacterium]|nr:hypothetical protein [Rhodospirillaceae bacterium]